MKTIGVRNLKATLSSVLRDVGRGDVYLVTDRGRVVAEVRPVGGEDRVLSVAERALARLASSGHLRVAEGPPAPYRPSPLRSPEGLARQLLDDSRGE